jgi:hypothetical protein
MCPFDLIGSKIPGSDMVERSAVESDPWRKT